MTDDFWRSKYQRPAIAGCCGDPADCNNGCVVSHPEIEQLAAEQSVYYDVDGNSAPLDEVHS